MSETDCAASSACGKPCLSCGACCAYFRVSFYWAEAELLDPALTEQLSPQLSCMRGSNSRKPRSQHRPAWPARSPRWISASANT